MSAIGRAPFVALAALALLVASAFAAACGSGSSAAPLLGLDPTSGGDGGAHVAPPPGASSGATGGATGASESDGGVAGLLAGDPSLADAGDGCSAAAKLVYLIDEESVLHAFLPSTLGFATIGTVRCPAADGAYPQSMAVDRSATAWVNYTSGEIFRVSTADASCQATSFVPNQAGLGVQYGMGFASNGDGSLDETLYILGTSISDAGEVGRGLGRIDTTSPALTLTPIGDFSGALAGQIGELTGTGTGALYGFFDVAPAELAQIDPSTGATSTPVPLPGVSAGTDFAFSFWGGDFWFYTANDGRTTDVTRLAASSDGGITVVASNLGFLVDGAGVSTCAPTVSTLR